MVKDGDVIVYAREDAGGDLTYAHPASGATIGWRFVPGEKITVGKDLPAALCSRLVEDGICTLVSASADTRWPITPSGEEQGTEPVAQEVQQPSSAIPAAKKTAKETAAS